MDPLDLDDDGWMEVKLGDAPPKRLDVFEVNNRLFELGQQFPGRENVTKYLQGVRDYLGELGFPGVSLRAADKFSAGVIGRVNALGNGRGGAGNSPASPASTDPAPSPSPTA